MAAREPGAPPPAVPRRTFLDFVLGAGFFSTAGAVFYPVWRFLVPPRRGEPETASVVAARLADLKTNSGIVFRFGNRPAIVIHAPDGTVKAFTAICTHLECTVQYRNDTSQIWCACHDGLYDLAGNVVSGPPPRALDEYAVNLRGAPGEEEVVVSRP
jgi:Rieske Fe-S protein